MYPKTKTILQEKLAAGIYPGAVFGFLEDKLLEKAAIGNAAVFPQVERMTEAHLFDVASLTKVICTTTVILRLWQKGEVELDAPLKKYLPQFENEQLTLRHLLTHTSDIKTWIPNRDRLDQEELRQAYFNLQPGENLGKKVQYTDAGTILLGFMLEELFQKNVTTIFTEEILQPLKMTHSFFNVSKIPEALIVPTQMQADGTILRGTTHDPKARVLKEHAGNAGLFTTLADILIFSEMFLNQGKVGDQQFLNPEVITYLLQDQTPSKTGDRSIGWDLLHDAGDQHSLLFHTGYTGTFLLLDPIKKSAFVFLSNRVHPNDQREEYLRHRDEIIAVYLKEKSSVR